MTFDLSKYKSTSDCGPESETKKNLIYGPPEAGKTYLASFLIDEGVFIISSERGNSSLAGFTIPTEHVNSIDEAMEIIRDIINNDTERTIKHIFIDSISDLISREAAAYQGDGRQAYGAVFAKYQKMMLLFESENAPEVWMIAHQDEETVNVGERKVKTGKKLPRMSGNAVWNKMEHELDLVARLISIPEGRKLQCRKTEKAFAKDRTHKLDEMEPADLRVILNKLRSPKGESVTKN